MSLRRLGLRLRLETLVGRGDDTSKGYRRVQGASVVDDSDHSQD